MQKEEIVKFIYSEKATKLCKIVTLLLTVFSVVKSKVNISQFVAFSEYMNFKAEIGLFQYFAQKSISIEKDQLLVKLTRKEVSGEGSVVSLKMKLRESFFN